MTRTEALIALNLVMDIGSTRLQRLLDVFGTPEDVFKASAGQLTSVCGVGDRIAANIAAFDPKLLDDEMALVVKNGFTVVTIYDKEYPANLKFTFDKPIVLYIKGRLDEQDRLGIAMVGCRRPSFYGIEQARRFASELAGRRITVISGMARGIDTFSHEGALKAGGRTIAVIGSGLGNIYPPENESLAQRISESGAVVSEFPVGAGPKRQNFPRRNRVISGLALGVFVVEAGINSGSLITAHFAMEQGRDVFVLPGKIDTPQAFGTNALIKDGASLVSAVEDILDELPFLANAGRGSSDAVQTSGSPGSLLPASLSCLESALYNIMSCHPISMDALLEKTNLSIAGLSAILLQLELKRLITQVSAGTYIRSPNAR
jgi:DNA processing protein